ncbi:MAG: FAD-dependent oxidoreductase [Rhodospirillales bacterium CG15_BIG_FIL_POST_REV_8_21_14_020_66_15]|nr:MAG: FAD-dependent oxidoreductase [Rhodospirillales bacterium CG15_BIG_FIL_POST_REV_8_21_14_020_66_15]
MKSFDAIVVGGGMLGAAVSYGLARARLRTALVDEGDVAFRAARGNFGLVWVQSKGDGCPEYAAWTRRSADDWAEFARELKDRTGVDVGHSRKGGFDLSFTEEDLRQREGLMTRLHDQAGGAFRFEMLDHRQLSELLPGLGPGVVGGSFCPLDGHANSLYLLRALHTAFQGLGGAYFPGSAVTRLAAKNGAFEVETGYQTLAAGRVVLAAGLANRDLAPQLGMEMPVHPLRGQIMVTERVRPFLDHPTAHVRQTVEGGLLLGDSKEDVGFDDGTTAPVMKEIARRATRAFPFLKSARIVRAWGALRVMTPDGFPVYARSAAYPGAFAIACHSGVTLAAAHAGPMADCIVGGRLPDDVAVLGPERFHAA